MTTENINIQSLFTQFPAKSKAIFQMLKFRLSLTVVFSAGMAYMLGSTGQIDGIKFCIFLAAGFLVTTSSNIINQIIEKDSDKLMTRTQNRPLPTGILNVGEALIICFVTGIAGLFLFISFININAALLAFASLVLYGFAYTPMKTVHPIAVFIGAIPGALPPMIGWVAATNDFGWEPGILFAIQFVWQFPHFWAIAWVLDEDYKKAGIRLLPGTGQDANTAFQIMIYTLVLIPLGFVPYLMGMTGIVSAIIALICGVLFLAQTFYLMKECSRKAARLIMFGSFLYLPIVQIAFVLDKVEKIW
jgi:protoheme IX farnesyltransferase